MAKLLIIQEVFNIPRGLPQPTQPLYINRRYIELADDEKLDFIDNASLLLIYLENENIERALSEQCEKDWKSHLSLYDEYENKSWFAKLFSASPQPPRLPVAVDAHEKYKFYEYLKSVPISVALLYEPIPEEWYVRIMTQNVDFLP